MGRRVTIPKVFYRDHAERDLPTPARLEETARHFVIDCDDPALAELLDDARHYATNGADEADASLVISARALVAAIERQCA